MQQFEILSEHLGEGACEFTRVTDVAFILVETRPHRLGDASFRKRDVKGINSQKVERFDKFADLIDFRSVRMSSTA